MIRHFARMLVVVGLLTPAATASAQTYPTVPPLPSSLPLLDYQTALYSFISKRQFVELGWRPDKAWRDTGPFLLSTNYGIHPAVKIYYSPEVLAWLEGGRKGSIPDGAMVVKEMANPPAARFNEYRAKLEGEYPGDPARIDAEMLKFMNANGLSWTVMVKDQSLSRGGWFFAYVTPAGTIDSFKAPFQPATGQAADGMCMRCHASSDAELIFSDSDNVEGMPGEPLIFRVDESWRNMTDQPPGPFNLPKWQRPAQGASEGELIADLFHNPARMKTLNAAVKGSPTEQNPEFMAMFPPEGGIDIPSDDLQRLPSEWLDHVPSRPDGPQHFLTSDNCLGCHGGLGGPPYGNTMFLQTGPNYGDGHNISEYGEWRWSPMGLAGRDPVFYAQLESEFAMLEAEGNGDVTAALGTTCLSCHGAMGQRQLEIDAHANPGAGLEPNNFKPSYTLLHAPLTEAEKAKQEKDGTLAYHQYGNLARDGISCAVCHHIAPPQRAEGQPDYNKLDTYLMNGTTGVFRYTPPDELIGPFQNVAQRPMENAMGIRPVHDDYIKDSEMCGACHTINLGNVGWKPGEPLPGFTADEQAVLDQAAANGAAYLNGEYGVTFPEKLLPFQHSVEQATYIEWVNSSWSEAGGASCQDCHMKNSFESLDGEVKVDAITTQIASIQDTTLPEVANLMPLEDITVPFREGYKRHAFVGLNAFMVEMVRQFRNDMGMSRTDPMTSATNGAQQSIDEMALQARNETSDVSIAVARSATGLTATVGVTNKTGHRMPSGVGFRRAFLEVKAVAQDGEVLWCSGCSNDAGVILGPDGQPLKTEFLDFVPAGADEALYQPHHEVIDDQTQVQIYEELTQDADRKFTTSFIRRIFHRKDNRLIPDGWLAPRSEAFKAKFGDSKVTAAFMKATSPEHGALEDPDFGPGGDTTRYEITLPDGVVPESVTVTATLMYQAIPPYYLKQRFETAPDQPATRRLYFLASRLETRGRLIEGWKIRVNSASARAG